MNIYIEFALVFLLAFMFFKLSTPLLIQFAIRIKLVDNPNARKIHKSPIPLVGGIGLLLSLIVACSISSIFWDSLSEYLILLSTSGTLLIVGVIDDKIDVKALYKLIIQFCCAYAVAASGIRISTLNGLFGIYELSIYWQYILTILLIVGVVNAFNLMDGVDGLAGGLALFGSIAFGIISFTLGKFGLVIIFASLAGGLISFLNMNFAKKLFMGDGGSLFLGFILVTSGIYLYEASPTSLKSLPMQMAIAFFLIPVLDSLRVYLLRISQGRSPFDADKNHVHHLFLLTGLNHKQTTFFIITFTIVITIVMLTLSAYLQLTFVLILAIILFRGVMNVLMINKNMLEWQRRIEEME